MVNIGTDIYHKETDSKQYLLFNSATQVLLIKIYMLHVVPLKAVTHSKESRSYCAILDNESLPVTLNKLAMNTNTAIQEREEERELICLLLFTCNYVVSVWRGFLFL